MSNRSTLNAPDQNVELRGQIERITYMNDETGFTVAKVTVNGFLAPVTIVGNLLGLVPG